MTRTLAVLMLAAAALPAVARAPRVPPATPAGEARNCIQRSAIQSTEVRDDSTIDFFMRDRKVYRNVLPAPCPNLGVERAFGYDTSIDQLCSVDIVTVVNQSIPVRGASCGLGSFQPVTGLAR